MPVEITNAYGWMILTSAVIVTALATYGLVSKTYHETFPENAALAAVGFSGAIVTLQIYATGYAQGSGIAWLATSVAAFAVARFYVEWREHAPHSTHWLSHHRHD